MENLAVIELKDTCYYDDDDFEYPTLYVEIDEFFHNNLKELKAICKNYDDFQEVDDYINTHFKKVNVEKITIEI